VVNRSFLKQNASFLSFGLVVAFFYSFGQTYFIGVFRPVIMSEFSLDNSGFGSIYLVVTLGSAFGLAAFGHIIDKVELRRYVMVLVGAITLVTLSFLAAHYLILLLISMLFIRMLGQGLMVHTAMTSMSRYFDKNRGRAIAIAGLGISLGQAVFPLAAVYLMKEFDWRTVWALFGIFFLVVGGPTLLFLLRGHDKRHEKWLKTESDKDADSSGPINSQGRAYSRRDVLKDYRFYMMMPALMSAPFWITAVFFFAEDIAVSKGWALEAFAGYYWINAVGAMTLPILAGIMVDRFGGVRLLPIYPPLLGLALFLGLLAEGWMGISIFMFLLGAVNGLAMPINNAMWAEMYGTRYLGQIKSLSTSLMVLSTALAPYLLGEALDMGVEINTLLMVGAIYAVISTLLLLSVRWNTGKNTS
jgi:MFS family permease